LSQALRASTFSTELKVQRVDKHASTAKKSSAKRTLQESGSSDSEQEPDSEEMKDKKRDPSLGVRDSDMSQGDESEESDEESSPAISDSDDSDTEWDEEKLMKANERKYWNK